jgi:pyruvate dehydrogenase complex dehydrogenase (E1) component
MKYKLLKEKKKMFEDYLTNSMNDCLDAGKSYSSYKVKCLAYVKRNLTNKDETIANIAEDYYDAIDSDNTKQQYYYKLVEDSNSTN